MLSHDTEFDLDRFLSYLENLTLNPPRVPVECGGSANGTVQDDAESAR
jgi:hypothetical protein